MRFPPLVLQKLAFLTQKRATFLHMLSLTLWASFSSVLPPTTMQLLLRWPTFHAGLSPMTLQSSIFLLQAALETWLDGFLLNFNKNCPQV